jgi:hypothetical protein
VKPPSEASSLSRQNNKTLLKHLAWLRATGKMSKWLEKRLEWDTATRDRILAEMFNRNRLEDVIKLHFQQHMKARIQEQFEKQDLFYKYYTGGH